MRSTRAKQPKHPVQEPPAWVGRLHLQPKPNIRTRRFFPIKPVLMLDDYLELEEQHKLEYSHRQQRCPLRDRLPAIDPNAYSHRRMDSARRDCQLQSQQLIPADKQQKARLLSPKILKFRSDSLSKRSRIFSADSKTRPLKQNSAFQFTFGRQEL